MADAVELFFDDAADDAVRALWQRLDGAGIAPAQPRHRPCVTLAAARSIPAPARTALRSELRLLSLPDVWLYTLGTFPGEEPNLVFGAVVDTELLAVHSAVHDTLAGKVTHASAYHFPGAWVPHCVLAQGISPEHVARGFALVGDAEPIRARARGIGVTARKTGETDFLTA